MVLALECPGVRIFFNEEKQRRICFRLSLSPEPVPAGTEVGSVRTPRSKSFFSTMENRTWHVRSGGRHCRRCEPLALEDDAASPSKFDENGYLTDPASVPERNRPAARVPSRNKILRHIFVKKDSAPCHPSQTWTWFSPPNIATSQS